ncbi:RES domain-containing protein [Comamonas sp. BIGb0124]|uniref:RES family NAD+ phosphorylase n=1 Tax=Comamonas sp. BIGb0124 TaxID=2485130 RepID=UPI000F4632FD|nr:RES family NAD+ phosphorylase [Comamonas sp. BIGb0124]ROR21467.1 RES domain-containing protein [Comamonas sp. BIGb0124]
MRGDVSYGSFWRISNEGKEDKAMGLSGAGGLYVGGRWHEKGNRIIYAAESVALACLETLVHYNAIGLPLLKKLIELRIPTDIIDAAHTIHPPSGWDTIPDSPAAATEGTRWLNSGVSLLTFVPSVIIPQEQNILINPGHADIRRIKVIDHGKYEYDPRLVGR